MLTIKNSTTSLSQKIYNNVDYLPRRFRDFAADFELFNAKH